MAIFDLGAIRMFRRPPDGVPGWASVAYGVGFVGYVPVAFLLVDAIVRLAMRVRALRRGRAGMK